MPGRLPAFLCGGPLRLVSALVQEHLPSLPHTEGRQFSRIALVQSSNGVQGKKRLEAKSEFPASVLCCSQHPVTPSLCLPSEHACTAFQTTARVTEREREKTCLWTAHAGHSQAQLGQSQCLPVAGPTAGRGSCTAVADPTELSACQLLSAPC